MSDFEKLIVEVPVERKDELLQAIGIFAVENNARVTVQPAGDRPAWVRQDKWPESIVAWTPEDDASESRAYVPEQVFAQLQESSGERHFNSCARNERGEGWFYRTEKDYKNGLKGEVTTGIYVDALPEVITRIPYLTNMGPQSARLMAEVYARAQSELQARPTE